MYLLSVGTNRFLTKYVCFHRDMIFFSLNVFVSLHLSLIEKSRKEEGEEEEEEASVEDFREFLFEA